MKEIEYGVYQLKLAMPCRPEDISYHAIKVTFDTDPAKYRAVSRVYSFSKTHNVWCGITFALFFLEVFDIGSVKAQRRAIEKMVEDGLIAKKGWRFVPLSYFYPQILYLTPKLVGKILACKIIATRQSCGIEH